VEGPPVSAVAVPATLTLRGFGAADLEAFVRFRRDPASAVQAYGTVPGPESPEQVQGLVQAVLGGGNLLWIWADETGRAVGFSLLTNVDRLNRTLVTGSGIFDPALRGRGLGSLGRRLVLDHVFNEMDFRRVYGEFAAFNEASRRSHEKMGVEFLGVRRQVFHVSGRYHDSVVYMMRRERFNELFPPDPDRYLAAAG
jgi:RimJ/RimL family protein N-acetyltransferase